MGGKTGFVVAPGASRVFEPLKILGSVIRVKLGGGDTDGAYAIMEDHTPVETGPPLHRHSREPDSRRLSWKSLRQPRGGGSRISRSSYRSSKSTGWKSSARHSPRARRR
jgi:hypothetical protein